MLLLNRVSAWIEVDKKELEQYGVETDLDHNRVTCWIAAQADKGFSVVYRDNLENRDHSLSSSLSLDGSPVKGRVLPPSTWIGDYPNSVSARTVVQKRQRLSTTSARAFMFSKLELTDEDEYLNQASTQLGEIQIRIYRTQILEPHLSRYSEAPGRVISKVHELSKKAVTHHVSYGQEVKTRKGHDYHTRHLDGRIPLVTFIFKYRDYGLLQANGIIPKPPPTKKKAAVFEEVLDVTIGNVVKPESVGEEMKIVENAAQSQKRTAVLTKRSNSPHKSGGKPGKRIKRENRFVPIGDVIDLT